MKIAVGPERKERVTTVFDLWERNQIGWKGRGDLELCGKLTTVSSAWTGVEEEGAAHGAIAQYSTREGGVVGCQSIGYRQEKLSIRSIKAHTSPYVHRKVIHFHRWDGNRSRDRGRIRIQRWDMVCR